MEVRILNYVYFATRDGNDLRNRLSQLKKGDNIDESFRGTVYQLTNALRVNNKKRFLEYYYTFILLH